MINLMKGVRVQFCGLHGLPDANQQNNTPTTPQEGEGAPLPFALTCWRQCLKSAV